MYGLDEEIDKQKVFDMFLESSNKIDFLHDLSVYCDDRGLSESQKLWVVFHISRDAQLWRYNK